jgi:hypothetical protein
MAIDNTVTVLSPIAPTSESDTYPVTNPKYGLGGLRTILGTGSDILDNIPTARREQGMLVYNINTGYYHTLVGGIDNGNWRQVFVLVPDAGNNIHIGGNLIVDGYVQTNIGLQGKPDDADVEYVGNDMVMDCGTY